MQALRNCLFNTAHCKASLGFTPLLKVKLRAAVKTVFMDFTGSMV
jgi:hypothetical protein